ncbi:MAG: hypothetical protein ACFFDT_30745 [Candidatus Hodarchaeota archaeon]
MHACISACPRMHVVDDLESATDGQRNKDDYASAGLETSMNKIEWTQEMV